MRIFLFLFTFLQIFSIQINAQLTEQYILSIVDSKKLNPPVGQTKISSQYRDAQTGITHVYLNMELNQIPVFGLDLAIHLDDKGNLIYSTGGFPAHLKLSDKDFHFEQRTEFLIQEFLRSHQCVEQPFPQLDRNSAEPQWQHFGFRKSKNDVLKFKKVYYFQNDELTAAYNIYWQRNQPLEWWNSIIDATTGAILFEDNQMKSCSFDHFHFTEKSAFSKFSFAESTASCNSCYNVFSLPIESPSHGSRSIVYSPWIKGGNASPIGWHHDGFINYYSSQGNNVDAYEDMDDDNYPTGGDAARAVGGPQIDYDFPYNPSLPPINNKNSAITNLFYWNNIMHDVWYQYGFNEQSGNFQYNNFGRGGLDLDNVIAEGLDFIDGARNNANFGTPPDGYPGHMQMYVWQKPNQDTIIIEAPAQIAGKIMYVASAIGPEIKAPLNGQLILVNDGSSNPSLGCANFINSAQVNGNIALVDRGSCTLYSKIIRSQSAGAKAVVIINNEPHEPFVIGGFKSGINIPVVMIGKLDGERIKNAIASGVSITLLPSSAFKLKINNESFIFSQASFGGKIPAGLTAKCELALDNVNNINDACQSLINGAAINGSFALIEEGNCEVSYKAYQVQQSGAVAALVCKVGPGYPDSLQNGTYGPLVNIPVLGLSEADCIKIKNLLPVQATLTNTLPALADGDFDAGIIAHEYGHGISTRLTGGPNNSNCLSNAEQAGEGWSDYFGLVMTQKVIDHPYKPRGIGSWPSGQPYYGVGVRPSVYSVDLNACPADYKMLRDLINISQPHGIGYVWCAMIWDLNWALVTKYGFEQDIYKSNSSAGNIKANKLIMEGFKLQACSPGFVDARNAILKADSILFGGANVCEIWNVFARRGLGYSANQGSALRRDDGVHAYNLPPNCGLMSEAELFGQRPLALEELALFVEKKGKDALLNWTVIHNEDLVGYELIRKSKFQGTETVAKLSPTTNTYVDAKISGNGELYYQLIAKGIDGKEMASNWVTINFQNSEKDWTLSPNPVHSELRISHQIKGSIEVHVRLLDLNLKELDANHFRLTEGDFISYNTSYLIPGTYLICLEVNGQKQYQRFVKL
jgi:hypothetical protein